MIVREKPAQARGPSKTPARAFVRDRRALTNKQPRLCRGPLARPDRLPGIAPGVPGIADPGPGIGYQGSRCAVRFQEL